ncbi:MAG: ribonuclease PH [Phycisphaerales bacterium]|nr:MAG: ribonuclease PH [Phycisphaerales bacterium]
MPRSNGRGNRELRPCCIERAYTKFVPGSVLMSLGDTRVLCTACFEAGVPGWRQGSGLGWVTAEYDMLPTAGGARKPRSRNRVDGRSQEIQRLIGRCLRAVTDMSGLGENSILLDCDVIQADGGTRTAAITGAYVALCDAVRHGLQHGLIAASPVTESVAAVSVGRVGGKLLLDLDYQEDAAADVDVNVVMTGGGRLVEIQGTAERGSFTRAELGRMVTLAASGIRQLHEAQERALRRRMTKG